MSRRIVEQPVSAESDRGTITTHPAFAQIGASRVTGAAYLYGSDFTHHAYMTVTIRRSQLHRDLSRDWHYATDELIQVALTEAQWATFVSSPNVGTGVPCTLDHFDGRRVPELPPPPERTKQFKAEIDDKLRASLAEVEAALRDVDGLGLSKAKGGIIKDRLNAVIRELHGNLPFVAEQFSEHAEETVEKAKAEVHGYMVDAIQRAGMEAIAGGGPLLLEAPKLRPDGTPDCPTPPQVERRG